VSALPMDVNNRVVKLCVEGSRAEFEGRPQDARDLYRQAWSLTEDDFEACIAAHYVARFQDTPQQTLAWNLESLRRAEAVGDERVEAFYPSLYVNLGHAYEVLGEVDEAQHFYKLAAATGMIPMRRVIAESKRDLDL
jgi:tetratricopeptide (TPR) repeat protein